MVRASSWTDPAHYENDWDYPYFDDYWTDSERHPYLIFANGERAGFILVNAWSPSGRGVYHCIAEFYVLPALRRSGIGITAAHLAFRAHPGVWELMVLSANGTAQKFWQRAIAAFAPEGVERFEAEGEHWEGVVFRFVHSCG